jgi:hypothetical protein
MKLSKDEIIKKLAEAIKENHRAPDTMSTATNCFFCDVILYQDYVHYPNAHKKDCPVLLAEEVLRDCQKCIHVGAEKECNCINGNKYQIKCKVCGGIGYLKIASSSTNCCGVQCSSCNGTGVEK